MGYTSAKKWRKRAKSKYNKFLGKWAADGGLVCCEGSTLEKDI